MDVDTQICYQFNLLSVLSWNEARVACQGQGADLLSITDTAEQKRIGDLSGKLNVPFGGDTFHLVLSWSRPGTLPITAKLHELSPFAKPLAESQRSRF